ncbi:hypothetical protein [Streptococcus sciuri]|uniref:type II site-specific deoxyribonuclease n=1 Tax=Streptococcus sciuri TaxID=2973939 RepID=A0ABT2F7C5_9STRE|nr:hypothetical protein [Streptococcus sciuri]MCS4487722.1 hypothetical protein [Streptococcus sciuri]
MINEELKSIMDEYIPSNFIKSTIEKLADSPERLTGVLHANTFELGSITSFGYSRNNSFGNAIESVFREIIASNGWTIEKTSYNLDDYHLKTPRMNKKKKISVDQVFSNNINVIFIEQKIRDDHDTSKWEGQWNNFEYKLKVLTEVYKEKEVIGIMWMIDDNFERNKNSYLDKIERIDSLFQNKVFLIYGDDIDNTLNKLDGQQNLYYQPLYHFLNNWHNESVKVPDLNFDKYTYDCLKVFQGLNEKQAVNFFTNKEVIEEVFPIIFPHMQAIKTYLFMLQNKDKKSKKEEVILPILEKLNNQFDVVSMCK